MNDFQIEEWTGWKETILDGYPGKGPLMNQSSNHYLGLFSDPPLGARDVSAHNTQGLEETRDSAGGQAGCRYRGVSFFPSVSGQSAASRPGIPSPTLPPTSLWQKSTVVMASQVVVVLTI